ncbi:Mitochondrial FAD carrier protein FLX1 [Spathaspora sp. JA1]|nr:Mitochondrial FAD carrier protein FLX1 [Spathaspora sp. JA1]
MSLNSSEAQSQTQRRKVELLSGISAGFATTIIVHPLDVIKVRLQLLPSPSSLATSSQTKKHFSSFYQVLSKIHQDALNSRRNKVIAHINQYYRGITPNLIGNVSAWGIYFLLYAEFKQIIPGDGSVHYFSSSACAGLSTSLITNPLWVLKTRILGSSRMDGYKGLIDGIQKMVTQEGVRSFYKGTIPSLFQVFQASLQFTFYDNLKAMIISAKNQSETATTSNGYQLTTLEFIYTSALAKVFSTLIMYPTQVVRARLQNTKSRGTITEVVNELRRDGIWGFYRGLSATLFRVVPATCITFVVYESVKANLVNNNSEE